MQKNPPNHFPSKVLTKSNGKCQSLNQPSQANNDNRRSAKGTIFISMDVYLSILLENLGSLVMYRKEQIYCIFVHLFFFQEKGAGAPADLPHSLHSFSQSQVKDYPRLFQKQTSHLFESDSVLKFGNLSSVIVI